ncbi:PKD domain-containing protein [Mycetocola sp. 2940]|uniref:PKD domain-containing protein n=1 Tax=Mycetocola sp. 2940 TaxID=3156452 RepID=UPI00339139C7
MNRFDRSARRVIAMTAATALIAAGVVLGTATAATAAPGPSPVEQRSATTATADVLPTVQIDSGVVWVQEVVGNIVYAGGKFTNARPAGAAPGVGLMPRSNILAYDIRTGVATSFAPQVNGEVKSLESSPDGSVLYVGGKFTSVGSATRYNIAAFSTATGALLESFKPPVGGSYVNGIVATGSAVYVTGLIGAANGVTRKNFAAFSNSGALLGWAPTSDLQGDALVLSPTKDKLIVGGRFGTVNGVTQRGLAALDLSTGSLLPWEAPNTIKNGVGTGTLAGRAGIWSLTTDANAVYGTGWVFADRTVGNLEGVFSAEGGSGKIRWIADCHGDHYGVYSDGTTVYSASHAHACETAGGMTQLNPAPGNMRNATALTAAPKGTLARSQYVNGTYADWSGWAAPAFVNWFPDWVTGTGSGQGQAGWSVAGNGQYVVYGGEFPFVNGQRQQGLARFSNAPPSGPKSAPRLTTANWVPTAKSVSTGTMRVQVPANWDRDDLTLTYSLYRTGVGPAVATATVQSTYWNRPTVTLIDRNLQPGATHEYRVVARDPNGNAGQDSTRVTATVSGSAASAYTNAVLDDGATLYWPLGGTSAEAGTDWAGTNNGVVRSGVTSTTPGAISGNAQPASSFNGTVDGLISSTRAVGAQTDLSVELWFKTNTTRGGKLIGYGSNQTGNSTSYDRHIYMQNDGRLVFGEHQGVNKTVTSQAAYNNNQWHHAVGTLGPTGLKFYVDGVLVGSDESATVALPFNGFWRVGGDNLAAWPNLPASQWFTGAIDEVAVYGSVLSASRVAAHYSLGSAQPVPTAAFTSSGTSLSVAFDASASTAPSGRTITAYEWNFGDGTALGSGRQVTHNYASAGAYTVTLTVTDSAGLRDTESRVVNTTAPHAAPVAAAQVSTAGSTVNVDGRGSTASDGATLTYSWDWGDGTADGSGATASHTYASAGTYVITLTATDSLGASDQATATVTIGAAVDVARDSFERSVASGWGTAEVGGAWSATTDFSVGEGTGKISVARTQTRTTLLPAASASNVDARMSVSTNIVADGGGTHLNILTRKTVDGDYRLKLRIASTGVVNVGIAKVVGTAETLLANLPMPGFTYTPGTVLETRMEVVSSSATTTTLRAKVWAAGQAEPTAWFLTTTDSQAQLQRAGQVGISAYVTSTNTNGPVLVRVDNVAVR